MERLAARSREIATILANDPVLVASAIVVSPCGCDAGVALWDYVPARRTFSFADLNGNVERFEARCELQRLSGDEGTGAAGETTVARNHVLDRRSRSQ